MSEENPPVATHKSGDVFARVRWRYWILIICVLMAMFGKDEIKYYGMYGLKLMSGQDVSDYEPEEKDDNETWPTTNEIADELVKRLAEQGSGQSPRQTAPKPRPQQQESLPAPSDGQVALVPRHGDGPNANAFDQPSPGQDDDTTDTPPVSQSDDTLDDREVLDPVKAAQRIHNTGILKNVIVNGSLDIRHLGRLLCHGSRDAEGRCLCKDWSLHANIVIQNVHIKGSLLASGIDPQVLDLRFSEFDGNVDLRGISVQQLLMSGTAFHRTSDEDYNNDVLLGRACVKEDPVLHFYTAPSQ